MKTTPGLRWACYAIAAAATGAAMWHVDHPADVSDAVQPARPAPRGLAMPVGATRPAANPDALALLKQRLDAALGGSADPFSDAGPVAQAAAVAAAAAPQPAAAPAEPVAPAMPFTYVGRWLEQGQAVVFLQAGDRVLSVKGPGPLEGSPYAVESIGADSLTLKMPGGGSQVLSFTAPAAAATARFQAAAESAAPAMEEN